jgi:hypothetical protein
MKTRARTLLFALALAAVPLAASAQTKDGPARSGFLADYSQLKPAPDREGVLLYVNPSAGRSGYTKLMFRPVEVFVSEGTEYKGIQPDALKRMTDEFRAAFVKALTPRYQIVTAAGPDVLEVRTAITGVAPAKPGMHPTDILPIKMVFNIGRAAAGHAPQVVELTAEMEVLDPSNRRVAAVVANRKGDKNLQQGEQITWAHLQAISDYWANNFRQRLDTVSAKQ